MMITHCIVENVSFIIKGCMASLRTQSGPSGHFCPECGVWFVLQRGTKSWREKERCTCASVDLSMCACVNVCMLEEAFSAQLY